VADDMRWSQGTWWKKRRYLSGHLSRLAKRSRTGGKYWPTASLPVAVRSKPIPSASARWK
jgi:hypothetical protein